MPEQSLTATKKSLQSRVNLTDLNTMATLTLKQQPNSARVQAARDQAALKQTLEKYGKDRASARTFLQRAGMLTPSGKPTKAYR
jgi:hypothetical protein